VENRRAFQFDHGALVLRDDALVVGELGVDEAHFQDDAVLLQHAHPFLHPDLDGAVLVLDKPADLRDAFPGDDHALVEFHDLLHLRVRAHDGEAVSVGRYHAHDDPSRRLLFGLQVDSVEIDPRFVGGHGEVGLLDHVADHGPVDPDEPDFLVVHDLRKLLRRDAGNPEVDLSAVDRHPVRILLLEVNLLALDFPDHLVEFAGRKRDLAVFDDLRLVVRNETDLPVRRHDADPFGLGPDENIVQHRHRRAPVHNTQSPLNTAQENVTLHTEFHKPVSFPSLVFGGSPQGLPHPRSFHTSHRSYLL